MQYFICNIFLNCLVQRFKNFAVELNEWKGRFNEINEKDVNVLNEAEDNQNIKNKLAVNLIHSYSASEATSNRLPKIVELSPFHIDTYLRKFLLVVRKKAGEKCVRTTLSLWSQQNVIWKNIVQKKRNTEVKTKTTQTRWKGKQTIRGSFFDRNFRTFFYNIWF